MRDGRELGPERSRSECRSIAILNYRDQDRRDLFVATRFLFKQLSKPTEGAEVGVKRVIRHLQKYPRAALHLWPDGEGGKIRVWADSDLGRIYRPLAIA